MAILRAFSLAKLLNSVYFDEKKLYSLKPVYGKVVPLASLPKTLTPRNYLSLYVAGNVDNRAAVLAFHDTLKQEGWRMEMIYVLTPKFGIVEIVDLVFRHTVSATPDRRLSR